MMRGQNKESAASPTFISPLPKPHLPRDEMHQDLEIDLFLLKITHESTKEDIK